MIDRYILKDGIAFPCADLFEWAEWLEANQAQYHRVDTVGGMRLSTIFMGINFRFDAGDPLLWETMLFNDDDAHEVSYEMDGKTHTYLKTPDHGQWRFSFKDDAYQFHDETLAGLQDAFDKSLAPFRFEEHKES